MSEETISNAIRQKIHEMGYKSVIFRLALIQEQQSWKIFHARFICDIANPTGQKTLLKRGNFALEDFSLSIDEFNKFLDYLEKVFVGKITFQQGMGITEDLLYPLGSYRLCFVGNYPSRELYFFRSEIGRQHGIDKPLYIADYSVHDSVRARAYQTIDLTGGDIPLTDPIDAINHFWGTNYEPFQISSSCPIYLPIYAAHISSCDFHGNRLTVNIKTEKSLVKLEELSLSIIVDKRFGNFRGRFPVKDNLLEINIGFDPEYAILFLNKEMEKLDEYYYRSRKAIEKENKVWKRYEEDRETEKEQIVTSSSAPEPQVETEARLEPLFDKTLITEMPNQIQSLLTEAERAFQYGLYRSAVILIRSALEEGLTLAVRKKGREEDLYDSGYEVGLQKKIRLASDLIPQLAHVRSDLEMIKWFGDKASHEAHMPIYKSDVVNNVEPRFRLFITKLIELKFNSP